MNVSHAKFYEISYFSMKELSRRNVEINVENVSFFLCYGSIVTKNFNSRRQLSRPLEETEGMLVIS